MSGQTFSESWHHVAHAQVSLIPSVESHKQFYRGEAWYVLRDPFNNRFYRVRPEAWQFLARLDAEKTVEQVWEQCLEKFPQDAPGQEEVIRLLAQLHMSNLLYFRGAAETQKMFERFRKHRQREIRMQLLSFLYFRVPLWNPEQWLRKAEPVIHALFGRIGLLIWLAVVALGLKVTLENWAALGSQAQGVLSPGNLPWLYLAMILMKTAHEFSHAMMCKRFGGEVHTMGVMFLIFTPLPYMDASSSWAFRNRWHRVLVGGAGMIAELFLAAVAAVVWVNAGEGTVKSLAFNMMLIGSVSSLIFNGNPLLRFDAYYMLSDALEIPNLYQRASQQWYYWAEKFLFRCREVYPVAKDATESAWLASYALLSVCYRFIITLGIVAFVADQLFFVGVVMFFISLYMWLITPAKSVLAYLARSPRLLHRRRRAVAISTALLGGLVVVVGVIPVGDSIRAPGVLEASQFVRVYASVPGRLLRIDIASGEPVTQGQVLAVMENPELDFDIQAIKAQINEAEAMLDFARSSRVADLKPLHERLQVLQQKHQQLRQKKQALHVTATIDGVWIAPDLAKQLGAWQRVRNELGMIIDPSQFEFNAVVSQEKAAELFQHTALTGEVRLFASVVQKLPLQRVEVIPFEQQQLPTAALGWLGGGDIEVDMQRGEGRITRDAFFKISAQLAQQAPLPLHGTLGVLRCELPSRPLAAQIFASLQQFTQKRYRL